MRSPSYLPSNFSTKPCVVTDAGLFYISEKRTMATDRAIWQSFAGYADRDATFEIYVDEVLVYSGNAYVAPDEDEVTIRANDIVRDYVSASVPTFAGGTAVSKNIKAPTADLYINDELAESARLIPDWSYDKAHNIYAMADPIDGIADPRSIIPYSFIAESGATKQPKVAVKLADGSVFSPTFASVSAGTVSIEAEDATEVTFDDSATYRIESTCKRYALYYVNAYGGVDLYIPKGMSTKTTSYKRSEYLRSSLAKYQSSNFKTDTVDSWSLNTGLMTEEQSMKMHHLIGSNDVRLFDMETGEWVSVKITDSSLTYKTYANSGRTFPVYTINVESAETRERR